MVTQETLQGHWQEIKGKLHARWGQLSDDELERARGTVEQLVGVIQRKTGAAREEIERYLDAATSDTGSAAQQASETVQRYAQVASERIQDTARQAADTAREGYQQAQQMVQQRPFESLAACFGIGMVTGVVLGLMLRSR